VSEMVFLLQISCWV